MNAGSARPQSRTGSVTAPGTQSVWELAWPSMALFALHALVGLVDLVFVASLGTQAVASVGVASQLHFFLFGLMSAITTGTVALVARESGAGYPERRCAEVTEDQHIIQDDIARMHRDQRLHV